MSGPRLDMIGLVVRDLKRSVDFYRALGVGLPDPDDEEGHIEATLPNGLRFALDTIATVKSFDPDWQEPSGGQRLGIAFLFDSAEEVDRAFEGLTQLGGSPHKEPWDAFWGQRYAQVRDPDGTVVDLFAWIEGQEE